MEKSLDAELLRRTPQGVELTNMGQQVYEHARNIVHESALMRDAVSASGACEAGSKVSASKVNNLLSSGYGR